MIWHHLLCFLVAQHIHGDSDNTVLYPEGVASITYYINRAAQCMGVPYVRPGGHSQAFRKITADQPEICYELVRMCFQESFRNNTASCDTWTDCLDNIEATFCTIEGKGHTYPGCPPIPTPNCSDIDGTRQIWAFFQRALPRIS